MTHFNLFKCALAATLLLGNPFPAIRHPARHPRTPPRDRRSIGAAIVALLSSLLVAGPASAALLLPNGSTVFNTGINVDGAGLDLSYTMTANPFNGSPNAFVGSAPYLSPNTADSAWISPSGPDVHAPESVYGVATQIDLTGLDVSSLSLQGFWVSDNQGLDILVNGVSTGQTNSGQHGLPVDAFPSNAFSISTDLVAGLNTIEFLWGNGPAGGAQSQFPNPIHVRVEFQQVSTPEPSALALLGLPMIGMLAWRRGRREDRFG
jgi:hypothetical protein